jgi:ribonuclease P protein component
VALKRTLRLRKNSDFQRVRQQRRSVSSRLLILAWASSDNRALNADANPRIGFVVGKRISKRAVERNYIKRLLGEAIRPVLADLPGGMDIVISAKNQVIIGSDLHILRHDIAILLRRAQLLPSARPSEAGR